MMPARHGGERRGQCRQELTLRRSSHLGFLHLHAIPSNLPRRPLLISERSELRGAGLERLNEDLKFWAGVDVARGAKPLEWPVIADDADT